MNTLVESKNIIMKKLLSSPAQKTNSGDFFNMDKMKNYSRDEEDGICSKLSTYLEHLCGQVEFTNAVELDHSYSKPWNWRPDSTYAKPLKSLFINNCSSPNSNTNDEILDPVSYCTTPKPAYEEEKARKLMDDTRKQIRLLRADVGDIDWDITVERTDWSLQQKKLFERGVKILQYDHLSRLSYVGNWNEPVLRRLSIDKSARRLRTLFANFSWQYQLIRWLHFLWLDILHHEYLVAYIEILQTLKKKVPSLIERLTIGPAQSTKANPDILFMLLQSPWDPASISLPCHAPRRLPGNPLLLIVPSGNGNSNTPNTRVQRWYSHLSAIGTVMLVNTNKLNPSKVTVTNSLEHLMASTRAKIAELKSDYIGRSIVLIGLNSGAALACQVSLVEPVSAVVCLGFPMNTVEEKRGQPDDSILNLNAPTLFVIGQHAATAHVNDMEDLRERLRVNTSLVVVGAADDCLRVSQNKKTADGMTQSMVDRCIVDEIADFIGSVLLTPNHKQDSRTINQKSRVKIVDRKRKLSGNDDLVSKKNRLTLSPAQSGGISLSMSNLNRPRKVSTPRSNIGRSKWSNEGDGRIQTVARKTTLDDKNLRAAIDSIRIINKNMTFKPNSITGETDEGTTTYSILSEIKVLGEDCLTEDFIGQLTADRLLEMPVIIAQEDGTGTIGSPLTGNIQPQLQHVKVMVTGGSSGIGRDDTVTITNDGKTELRQPTGFRCVQASSNKTSTIHIGRTTAKALQAATTSNNITTSSKTVTKSSEDSIRGSMAAKCTTIYFKEGGKTSTTSAQLHKMEIMPRGHNQSAEFRRRNISTQLLSRPRPPRIRNFPAVKHSRSDMPSPGHE